MTTLPWDGQVNKMWARSENDIYLVGMSGSIYHYTGDGWQKMVSGTTVDLLDVWGDAKTGVVWACGSDYNSLGSVLLKYENGQWRKVWEKNAAPQVPPFGGPVGSVWSSSHTYVTSMGVFEMDADTAHVERLMTPTEWTRRLRGSGDNDIFGVGQMGMIWHYNGASGKELRKEGLWYDFMSCDVKGNTAVAVGTDGFRALMYIGKRLQPTGKR